MRACLAFALPLLLVSSCQQRVLSFILSKPAGVVPTRTRTVLAAESVEVCGFKDCRRAGGGARLEKLVKQVLEEKGLESVVKVEGCDCQGECGYGPNIVVDGKLINDVKGKDAVVKALGIEE